MYVVTIQAVLYYIVSGTINSVSTPSAGKLSNNACPIILPITTTFLT